MQRQPSLRPSRGREGVARQSQQQQILANVQNYDHESESLRLTSKETEQRRSSVVPRRTMSTRSSTKQVQGAPSSRVAQRSSTASDQLNGTPTTERRAVARMLQLQPASATTASHRRAQSLAMPPPTTTASISKPPTIPGTPRQVQRPSRMLLPSSTRPISIAYPPSSAKFVVEKRTPRPNSSQSQDSSTPPSSISRALPLFATPLKRSASTRSTGTPSSYQSPQVQASSQSATTDPRTMRVQLHLLHLSLLHSSSQTTFRALTASARASLQRRHTALQATYAEVLQLRRQARQARNIRALHAWCGGNMVALTRKLNTLISVLSDVLELTDPDGGRYAGVVVGFEAWRGCILKIWATRDERETQRIDCGAEPMDGEEFSRIEGMGDGVRTEIRELQGIVGGMVTKMEGLTNPGIPVLSPVSMRLPDATTNGETIVIGTPDETISTPALLLGCAKDFVDGMRDELQMMREIEFEVEVGEKMWVEDWARRKLECADDW